MPRQQNRHGKARSGYVRRNPERRTSGPAIVPGKSVESLLYLRITGAKPPSMPLSAKKLAAGEIETIRQWIDAGAQPPAPGEMETRPPRHSRYKTARRRQTPHRRAGLSSRWQTAGPRRLQRGPPRGPATGKLVATLPGEAEDVRAVAFSADGKLLAAAGGLPGRSGEVKIWDVEKRAPLRTITGHADCIYAVEFAPDGKSIATASYDKLIKLWDSHTGKEIRTLKDHIDAVYALAFTPDGKRLVSASADRGVKVWDVASGERLYTLSEPTDGLNTLAIDPAGKRVAAAGLDRTIRVWSLDEKGGTLLTSLIAHEDAILQLAWSPDGKYLISSSADKEVKMFQADDLTVVKTWRQPDWALCAGVRSRWQRASPWAASTAPMKSIHLLKAVGASMKPLLALAFPAAAFAASTTRLAHRQSHHAAHHQLRLAARRAARRHHRTHRRRTQPRQSQRCLLQRARHPGPHSAHQGTARRTRCAARLERRHFHRGCRPAAAAQRSHAGTRYQSRCRYRPGRFPAANAARHQPRRPLPDRALLRRERRPRAQRHARGSRGSLHSRDSGRRHFQTRRCGLLQDHREGGRAIGIRKWRGDARFGPPAGGEYIRCGPGASHEYGLDGGRSAQYFAHRFDKAGAVLRQDRGLRRRRQRAPFLSHQGGQVSAGAVGLSAGRAQRPDRPDRTDRLQSRRRQNRGPGRSVARRRSGP